MNNDAFIALIGVKIAIWGLISPYLESLIAKHFAFDSLLCYGKIIGFGECFEFSKFTSILCSIFI